MGTLTVPWLGVAPAEADEAAPDLTRLREQIAVANSRSLCVGEDGAYLISPDALAKFSPELQAIFVASAGRAKAFQSSLAGPRPADAMEALTAALVAAGIGEAIIRELEAFLGGVLSTDVRWSGVTVVLDKSASSALSKLASKRLAQALTVAATVSPSMAALFLVVGAAGAFFAELIETELQHGDILKVEFLLWLIPVVDAVV